MPRVKPRQLPRVKPRQLFTWTCHVRKTRQLLAWQTLFGSLTEQHVMTKTGAHRWRIQFVIEWSCFYDNGHFVTEWIHIYDENSRFVTVDIQWRSFHDETHFVTSSSQKILGDDFRVFRDESVASLMSTSLVVVHRRQVLLKFHRHVVHRSKASNLPFTLATGPSSQVLSLSSLP
jgi:hypothetical protein